MEKPQMTLAKPRTCSGCKWWFLVDPRENNGECRSRPPQLTVFMSAPRVVGPSAQPNFIKYSAYPVLNTNTPECGDYAPRLADG